MRTQTQSFFGRRCPSNSSVPPGLVFFSGMKWFPLEMYWTFSFTELCRWWSLNHLKFTFSYLSAAELNIVHSLQCISYDIVELCDRSNRWISMMLLCLNAFFLLGCLYMNLLYVFLKKSKRPIFTCCWVWHVFYMLQVF